MAATTVKNGEFVHGPYRTKIFTVTLTSATSVALTEVDHGLRNVLIATFNNESTEGDGKVVISAINTVTLSGFTSDDVVKLHIVGN